MIFYDIKLIINHQIFIVVQTFGIQNAAGKKIHIYDHLNTRVNDDDTLNIF